MTESDSWGCAPVFVGVILVVGACLFGALVVLPGLDRWVAGNEQQTAIRAQAAAQIAQLEAARDLEIAKAQAQRDIEIARDQADAAVQMAALDLAGRAVDSTAGTLRMLLLLGFSSAILVLVLLTVAMMAAYTDSRRRHRRDHTPRWMTQPADWQPAQYQRGTP